MKTFLNVLYRRILYKIPLKLLLVLLAIFGLLFACTKAGFELAYSENFYNNGTSMHYNSEGYDMTCLYSIDCERIYMQWLDVSSSVSIYDHNEGVGQNMGMCYTGHTITYTILTSACHYRFDMYNFTDYTSQECQSEYNLIPISEVDSSYCQSNNLCPSGGTPSDCPNVGVSNLFINDIFHPGAFNIIMNIPEEISRDYAYTNSGNNFNLDIEGYNVDYEKMQSIIDKQSYIPTNEDFQNIILLIGPYGKIIIFFVFLFILWAWIKKPFKSKL